MSADQRKRKRRCQFECKDHIFMLQALKSHPSKYDIQVQFCPKYQRQPLPPERTFPEFNNDFKFYTSAFILGVDKRILAKNQQQEIMDHQKQIRDSLEKHNQLIFPRPNSKHSLCSVCKQHYKNYYAHIASEEHRERISYSQYNNHIKEICSIYIDLWRGAEERADQQAEKRALQEEERKQKMAEQALLHIQDSNSLLDCQRGEQEPEMSKQNEQYPPKPSHNRKAQREVMNNDDTVPINSKTYKRGATDRSLYQPPMRKRYTTGNQFNPSHALRERKQRVYQRERDKLMRGTQFQHFKKHFRERPANQDDVFIVLQPIEAPPQQPNQQLKKSQEQKGSKKVIQETEKKLAPIEEIEREKNQFLNDEEESQVVIQRQVQQAQQVFEDKRSQEIKEENREIKLRQMNSVSHEEGELSNSESDSDSSSSLQRSSDKDNKTVKNEVMAQRDQLRPQWKAETRPPGYSYPYPPPMQMHPSHLPAKNMHTGPDAYKGINAQYAQHYKNLPEAYKRMPPYYYNPYQYPMYDPQYMKPNQKGHEQKAVQNDKRKSTEKPYEYPMPYPWSYNPYYMPPMPPVPPSQHSQHSQHPQTPGNPHHPHPNSSQNRPQGPNQTIPGKNPAGHNPNNPYLGGTSININFPMYMYPPHPSMPGMPYSIPNHRYPMPPMMNPYMGYQEGTYNNQQERHPRQGEYRPAQQPPPHYQPPHGSQPNNLYPQPQLPPPYPNSAAYTPANMTQSSNNNGQTAGNHPVPSHPYYYPHPYGHYSGQMSQQKQKGAINTKQL